MSPLTQPTTASEHYFWDERTDSFWKDQYPAAQGPSTTLLYNTDDPARRAVLIGGYDGYVRFFDPNALDDDGTAISSRIRFTPITPGGVFASSRLNDIHIVTDTRSGAVNFSLFTGDTAQTANTAATSGAARLSRVLVAGRNTSMRQRISQNTLVPVMAHSVVGESWAFESGGATVELLNRMHGKRV